MADVEILRAACCVAGLDGEIDESERRYIDKLATKAGVGSASLGAMMDRARSDRNFYEEQFHVLKADPDRTIAKLCLIAVADGDLTLNERVILQHFADRLGMTADRFEELFVLAQRGSKQTGQA